MTDEPSDVRDINIYEPLPEKEALGDLAIGIERM